MIVPLFFQKEPIPAISNPKLLGSIEMVKEAKTKAEALKTAFEIINKKYLSLRFRTYLLFWRAWETDPNTLWERKGFMHCTQQNHLLRVLLIKSGWFDEDEIKLGYALVWCVSPHQFLKVKLDHHWLAADPWNADYGAVLGQYAAGFGFKSLG